MNFANQLQTQGAQLATDGIPLHFGDLAAEYDAALEAAVLLVRSHEGRLEMTGRDRLALIHRISTNHVESLPAGTGAATVFTNANARILDRVVVVSRPERALVITEPGRGVLLEAYLRRNIFFNDEVQLVNLTGDTVQFALHGPQADAVVTAIVPDAAALPLFGSAEVSIADQPVMFIRNKPLASAHWTVILPAAGAAPVWQAIMTAGATYSLIPAGSLTYNTLRIRAGRPGVGRELSEVYNPLEVGLWDEISFNKGCYTGQEIIARMESRNRLARVMVRLTLQSPVEAPVDLSYEGRIIGRITSSVTTPRGEHLALGIVKPPVAVAEHTLSAGPQAVEATILGLAAVPPPMVEQM